MSKFLYQSTLVCILSLLCYNAKCQSKAEFDSLKMAVFQLNQEVADINLRINTSESKLKTGILVATIGYSVTIAGGLMLGRENDTLGQVLLISGGATGVTGTYLMVDAFSFLSGKKRKRGNKKPEAF